MVLGEDVEGLIVAVFADQVSGTFGEEPRRVLVGSSRDNGGAASYITVTIWIIAGAI
jgi:hypothetical protein